MVKGGAEVQGVMKRAGRWYKPDYSALTVGASAPEALEGLQCIVEREQSFAVKFTNTKPKMDYRSPSSR